MATAGSAAWLCNSYPTGEREKHSSRPVRPHRISPRQVAILTTRADDQLTQEQRILFDQLSSTCPDLNWMRTLALEFRAALFTSKDRHRMSDWIRLAKCSGIIPVARFAFGLQKTCPL